MNFQQSYLYWLAGIVLLIVAIMSWQDKANPRRLTTGLFWGVYGLLFLLGDWTYQLVGDKRTVNIAVGVAVVIMALIAGFGGVKLGSYHQRTREQREESATRLGNRLFYPALAIPVVTVIGVLMFNHIPGLQDALFGPGNHATLVTLFSMTAGSLIGLGMAIKMTHEKGASAHSGGAPPAGFHRLGIYFTADPRNVRTAVYGGRRWQWHFVSYSRVSGRRQPLYRGGGVYHWDGAVDDGDGQCVCRLPDCHGGNWHSDSGASARWQPGGDGGYRDVLRLLRYADDADGGKLQHRARRAAGTAR